MASPSVLENNWWCCARLSLLSDTQGWDQGLQGICVGEKRELTVPPYLAYGKKSAGPDVPPGSTLHFEVECLKIEGSTEYWFLNRVTAFFIDVDEFFTFEASFTNQWKPVATSSCIGAFFWYRSGHNHKASRRSSLLCVIHI